MGSEMCIRDRCRARAPLEIDHIKEWADVREHKFENLIVLCSNCHGLKRDSASPRHINHASLKKIKNDLMMLSARYSDMERRFIEIAQEFVKDNPDALPTMQIHHTMRLMFKRLNDDKYVDFQLIKGGFMASDAQGNVITNDEIKITLTNIGREFIKNLNRVD